ncbi:MAG: histidine kinase dimerization/phosphoacceptor domain -containing protein [Sphingobium sp.]
MNDDADKIQTLLRQQAALARFGSFALREGNLHKILTEAARACADGLDVPFSKVCRYRADGDDLLMEAGVGWHEGVVGHVVARADISSPQGRAFITGKPSICANVNADSDFELPPFFAQHRICSTIDVLIKGATDNPWGVLEVDSDQPRDFDGHDIDFLTGFANVLAEAVDTSERTLLLQATIDRMQELMREKDRLLDQKVVLAEELQHRVRNNLLLVYGMLTKQLNETSDEAGRRGLKAISRRVSTLSQVYDQLLGTQMTRTIDFGQYVTDLCRNLAEVQEVAGDSIALSCDCAVIELDLDVVTALGIIVAELITNSFDHAFAERTGTVKVSVKRRHDDRNAAILLISDNGSGFEPQVESKRHGLGLVRRLVEQIGGEVQLTANGGSHWTISFPAPDILSS